MRRWDYKAAQRPDHLIANSNYTKANILKHYGRDSSVIHPPVSVDEYGLKQKNPRSGFIVTGRQTPYKRIDLAVLACTKLNLKLNVIGDGPEHMKLRAIAGPTIKFLGQVDNKTKASLLSSAKAFIFPGIDDFGISAVEALASGTPVIAFNAGGALDYMNSDDGILFDKQSVSSLCRALEKFNEADFDHQTIKTVSRKFSIKAFREQLSKFLSKLEYRR
jgi:glycosyltransferase involved in cell wall biosynthesis